MSGIGAVAAKKVVVLGGGVSGLSVAHFLAKKYGPRINVTVFEKEDRFGGWVDSKKLTKPKFIFETGPRSLRTAGNGKTTLKLIEELGLQDQLIVANREYASKRFLFSNGKLELIPPSLLGLVKSPLTRSAIPSVIKEFWILGKPEKEKETDESIHDFMTRRFGSYIANTFVAPLVLGIYGGNTKNLSIKSCFNALYEAEKNHGSVLRGMLFFPSKKKIANEKQNQGDLQPEKEEETPFMKQVSKEGSIFSFKSGLDSLTSALRDRCRSEGIELISSSSATKLSFESGKNSPFEIEVNNSNIVHADHVFSTLPSNVLASILPASSLTRVLNDIKYVNIAVVNIGYDDSNIIPPEFRGFGYLIPPKEKQRILGVTFDSWAFPQQNSSDNETRLTVMVGGDPSIHDNTTPIETLSEEQITKIALDSLREHLNINTPPKYIAVKVCTNAIPQYHVGHKITVSTIESLTEKNFQGHLTLVGNSYYGVGLNDCIKSAKDIVEKTELDL